MSISAIPVSVPLADASKVLRIGLVTLASDPTIESSFRRMLASHGNINLYVNRIAFDGEISVDTLRAMEGDIRACAAEILPDRPLDVLLYGCTSASAAIGDQRVLALLRDAKPDVKAVASPVTGFLAACTALKVRRVSVLTPYTTSVSNMLGAYLEGLGVNVVAMHCLGLVDDWDNGRVTPEALCSLASGLDHGGADAVFLSCTALQGAEAAARLETLTGLPVVTSNQALLWHGLRLAEQDLKISGFGRLMEL